MKGRWSPTPDQLVVCSRFNVAPVPSAPDLKVGVSRGLRDSKGQIHGLRHAPTEDTTGWYLWTGEYSDASDFFEPLHLTHLMELCPQVVRYLALPPGWRFLIADGYEDVWYDSALLERAR